MRKTIFYILLLFFFSIELNAQVNLVPNPSFEDTIHCPTTFGQINFCKFWYNPTAGTPDYFNSCANYSTGMNVPSAAAGYQLAHTGIAYAGFLACGLSASGGPLDYREYIQTILSDTLKPGVKYCISFYVNFPNYENLAVDRLGLYLSSTAINLSTPTVFSFVPQIESTYGVFITDTLQWYKIEGTYLATGGEKYITIGNFRDTTNTDTLHTNSSTASGSYYYIDDINIMDCADTTIGVQEYDINKTFKLYPNPNKGTIQLEYSVKPTGKISIKIYDVTGKLVQENALNPNTNRSQLNMDLKDGVYLYQIIANDHIMKSDKLVIIK